MTPSKLEESIDGIVVAIYPHFTATNHEKEKLRKALRAFAEAVRENPCYHENHKNGLPCPDCRETLKCSCYGYLPGHHSPFCNLRKPPEPAGFRVYVQLPECKGCHCHVCCKFPGCCPCNPVPKESNDKAVRGCDCNCCNNLPHLEKSCHKAIHLTDLPAEVKEKIKDTMHFFRFQPADWNREGEIRLEEIARLCLSIAARGRG